MSEQVSAGPMSKYLSMDERLWRNERPLLEHVRVLMIHKLNKEDFEVESAHVREALRSTASLSNLEDSVAIANHLVALHGFIQSVRDDSKLLEVALEEALRNPSDITLKRFEDILAMFVRDEEKKIARIKQAVDTLRDAA